MCYDSQRITQNCYPRIWSSKTTQFSVVTFAWTSFPSQDQQLVSLISKWSRKRKTQSFQGRMNMPIDCHRYDGCQQSKTLVVLEPNRAVWLNQKNSLHILSRVEGRIVRWLFNCLDVLLHVAHANTLRTHKQWHRYFDSHRALNSQNTATLVVLKLYLDKKLFHFVLWMRPSIPETGLLCQILMTKAKLIDYDRVQTEGNIEQAARLFSGWTCVQLWLGSMQGWFSQLAL